MKNSIILILVGVCLGSLGSNIYLLNQNLQLQKTNKVYKTTIDYMYKKYVLNTFVVTND